AHRLPEEGMAELRPGNHHRRDDRAGGGVGSGEGGMGAMKSERGTRNAEQQGEVDRSDARVDVPRSDFRVPRSIVDSHMHFWDPGELHYPWLTGAPSLDRALLPPDYAAAPGPIPTDRFVF